MLTQYQVQEATVTEIWASASAPPSLANLNKLALMTFGDKHTRETKMAGCCLI